MQTRPPFPSDQSELPTVPLKTVRPKQRAWQRPLLIALLVALLGSIVTPLLLYALKNHQATMKNLSHSPSLSPTPTVPPTPTVSPTPAASPTLTSANAASATQIDALLTGQVNAQQFSGSVLVARDGQTILAKGYSTANWETQAPNTPDTRYFLGSVTKEFTAMSILILQQQGKLQVTNPICNYVASCPAPWQPVTVQQVLTHTSGIPELDDSPLPYGSPQGWLTIFDNASLAFPPGTEFGYCSVCYEILAYVVQLVSGMPYDQFVQQQILDPLHMNETSFDATAYYANSSCAIGYDSWQSESDQLGWQLSSEWDFLNGSGLLYSTVTDLYRWDQALVTNKLVSPQIMKQIFTPYVTANLFPGSQYGYGWFISQAPVQGHQLIWHDGVIDGFRNFNGLYIDDHVTIIIQSNLASIDIIELSHSIEQILFGGTSSN